MTKTEIYPLCSKYGTLCNKVMSATTPRSDYESSQQCGRFLRGAIGLPFLPVFCTLDIISFPFRKIINKCKKE